MTCSGTSTWSSSWGGDVGACDVCLSHAGALSLTVPLEGGRTLSVNLDAAKLARSTLAGLVLDDASDAALVAEGGQALYHLRREPRNGREAMTASVDVPGTGGGWRVEVSRPRAEVAPDVRNATRFMVGSALIAAALAVLALGVFVGYERRRHRDELAKTRALARQDKLALLGLLSAATAHEIRNALAIGKLGVFAVRDEAPAELGEPLGDVMLAMERLEAIVDRLSRFVGETSGEAEVGVASVADAITEARAIAGPALRHGPPIEVDIDPPEPEVAAPRSALAQVLVNLFVNASHAMVGREGAIRIRAARSGSMVELSVEDDGPGIPAQAREQIFEPLFTTKEEGGGTGLGLWISRRIIEERGGSLRAGEGRSGGARFTVVLPATAP